MLKVCKPKQPLLKPDTIKGCTANLCTLNYQSSSNNHSDTLRANITGKKYCGGDTTSNDPIYIELIDTNITLTKIGKDWIFTVTNGVTSDTINFNIWIDCTVIDIANNNTAYSLNLEFTSSDTLANNDMISGGLDSITVSPLIIPWLNVFAVGPNYASNLDSTCVITAYTNQSSIAANLNFMFDTLSGYCNELKI
ncbi:MAG: hypothetical protein IPP29_08160 [Bacteroidetes bacterium]|nr:hypothetical protein [Bacteroidota bacterium]